MQFKRLQEIAQSVKGDDDLYHGTEKREIKNQLNQILATLERIDKTDDSDLSPCMAKIREAIKLCK
jgi:hypothetical protein